jgi:Protein of unknown function (DUF2281)
MTILETIVNELESAPEPLLTKVLDFIQSSKNNAVPASNASSSPRIAGLHQGKIWMSEDFNGPSQLINSG